MKAFEKKLGKDRKTSLKKMDEVLSFFFCNVMNIGKKIQISQVEHPDVYTDEHRRIGNLNIQNICLLSNFFLSH